MDKGSRMEMRVKFLENLSQQFLMGIPSVGRGNSATPLFP